MSEDSSKQAKSVAKILVASDKEIRSIIKEELQNLNGKKKLRTKRYCICQKEYDKT